MEWLASLRKSIDYMEEHLLADIGAMEVADAVHISPFYFQKGFKIVTGYSISEYLRNRRLYLAGLDVIRGGGDCREKAHTGKEAADVPKRRSSIWHINTGMIPRKALQGLSPAFTAYLPCVFGNSLIE